MRGKKHKDKQRGRFNIPDDDTLNIPAIDETKEHEKSLWTDKNA